MDCEYLKRIIFMLFPICINEEDEEEIENTEIPEAVPICVEEDCVRAFRDYTLVLV
jgi:hypothetical protein